MLERLDGKLAGTLKAARTRHRLTQKAVALRAGVSRRHLADMESGANVSVRILIRVCHVLGLSSVDVGEGVSLSVGGALPVAPSASGELLAHLDEIAKRARLARRVAMRVGTPRHSRSRR